MSQPPQPRASATRTGARHAAHAARVHAGLFTRPTRAVEWACTLVVALFGALLRFVRLGEPRAVVFLSLIHI